MLIGSFIDWQRAYQAGATPADLLAAQLAACQANDPAWISLATPELLAAQVAQLHALEGAGGRAQLPLYGIPFAVKDNIDVAGFTTTAACPDFAYVAQADAVAVQRLKRAGAIVLGKTNLDQFATGLVGTRSPYGAVPNTFDPTLISGGSSSGSASVVARGIVPFGLSTDTAGSGRVPAGFNQLVGLKPTPGAVSGTGLVPACRSLDCIGVLALNVADSALAMSVMEGFDPRDGYSKTRPAVRPAKPLAQLRVGIPANRQLSADYEAGFTEFVARLQGQTAEVQTLAFDALFEVAKLLYYGPWVAERVAGARHIYEHQPESMLPVIRKVFDVHQQFGLVDAFTAQYRLQDLKREAEALWEQFDVLCVPSSPRHPSTAEVNADPIGVNSEMGTYTNFVNLLGWSAIAIPACTLPSGLPFGITLIAPSWMEPTLVQWAQQLQAQAQLTAGATGLPVPPPAALPRWHVPTQGDTLEVAVVGAHLRGMPLNHELLACGARFKEETRTSADYRLYALANTTPPKPGLAQVSDGGAAIVVEVWEMPLASFGQFVAGVPSPLGIGSLTLQDGRTVKGFICEGMAIGQATEVTQFGGWRAYVQSKQNA